MKRLFVLSLLLLVGVTALSAKEETEEKKYLSDEERTVSVAASQYEGGEKATELWSNTQVCAKDSLTATLAAHDAVVYLVK